MSKPYSAEAVASYIIAHDRPMTNRRLQSLLYQMQAAYLIYSKTPLFEDDILACSDTVKIPSVWSKYHSESGELIPCSDDPESYSMISSHDRARISRPIDVLAIFDENRLFNVIERGDPFLRAIWKGENTPVSLDEMRKKFL